MKRIVIATLALLCAVTSASFAATYYVSPTGNDENDGLTPQTAFASLNAADSKGLIAPGDRVEVLPGEYNLNRAKVSFTTSGTDTSPVTYATDGAVLKNADYAFGGRADNIVIDGFTINDSDTGVQFRGSNITVRNCVFENISEKCVSFMGDCSGEIVENCRFLDFSGDYCVQISGVSSNDYGSDNIFRNNIFRGITGIAVNILGTSSNKFYNNTFLDTGDYIFRIMSGNKEKPKTELKNNIFADADKAVVYRESSSAVITHSHNMYFNNATDYGLDLMPAEGDLFGDPMLDPETFTPVDGSVVIDMGTDVGLLYNGTAPDIGAVESVSQTKPGIIVARALRQEDNGPVANVTIYAGNHSAITGEDGLCRIPVPAGEWDVYADNDNVARFEPLEKQTVTVELNETVQIDVYGKYRNNTYYVNVEGSGYNCQNGTRRYPFSSISRADNNGLLEPGDTVVISGSYVASGTINRCSGTEDNPIVYKGINNCKIYTLVVNGVSNITFDGITFDNKFDGVGFTASAVALKISGDNISVKNCCFSGAEWGITAESGNNLTVDNCRFTTTVGGIRKDTNGRGIFTRNALKGMEEHAMLLSGVNTVYNNTIRDAETGIEVLSGYTEAANNIISNCEKGFVCGDGAVLANSYNLLNCVTSVTGCAAGENTIYADPQIIDFALAPGSPAVDAGKDLGFAYNGTAPDLGAVESVQSEYVPVSGDFSDLDEGTFVTIGNGYVVTATSPVVLTREDRLGGICCPVHADAYGLSELKLGDRVVLKGIVNGDDIRVFDIASRQPGEELKPFLSYTLLKPNMLQRVVGKVKTMPRNERISLDTGKEILTVVLPESMFGKVYIDNIVTVTGVVRDGMLYARTTDDFSQIRTNVLQVRPYNKEVSVDCSFGSIVPADNVADTWGKAWLINATSGQRSAVRLSFNGFEVWNITLRIKFDEIPNGNWNIFANTNRDSVPFEYQGKDGDEFIYKCSWDYRSSYVIISVTPWERPNTGNVYSAKITGIYIPN